MGQTRSWDSPWDLMAMSTYGTITSLAESPVQEGLLWAGTDDGLLHVTADGGASWRAIEVGSVTGLPENAFVNDIKADLFEADTVYVALDNHKGGDYAPYLMRSLDRGQTWQSMRGNLPDRTLVWRVVQDHVRPELLFAGTEAGVFFTADAGKRWTQLQGGVPRIPFRDLALHRRDDDLVGASFGRGFFVFDDLRVLREVTDESLAAEAALFSTRKAWWYFPRPHLAFESGVGDQGASHFVAPNPPFGAVFTYYLKDELQTRKQTRQEREKSDSSAAAFPGWEAVQAERDEPAPQIWLTVRDAGGNVVRRLPGPVKKGFHRVAWDLRYPAPNAVPLAEPPPPEFGDRPKGLMAAPGTYTVSLSKQLDGTVTALSIPQTFDVVPLRHGALPAAEPAAVAAFWRAYENAVRRHTANQLALALSLKKTERLRAVIEQSRTDPVGALDAGYHGLRKQLLQLDGTLNGDRARQEAGEKFAATISDRLSAVARGVDRSTYGPTASHRRSLEIAVAEIRGLEEQLDSARARLDQLVRELVASGAPWLEDG